ncbi:phosphotransferase [Paracoccus sp. SSJ]|uniref:phosphotransferase n=1 Tax=Paracoccus sp. SSJ TaxID=3050636 RepID=UPI00254D4A98|nr:phosphotransferase [Paracoccus sp. SSJ]MDK8873171.1 phosphotransferase [Paracoccus sp. SSJ]
MAALPGIEPLRLVRDRPDRLVMQVRLDGRTAWLKQFCGTDPAASVAQAQARLRQAAEVLGQDLDAVAPPLLALPERGILITAPAPGQPIAQLLAGADDAQRAALIARMGSWLRQLAGTTRTRGRFGPRFWLNGLRTRIAAASGDWIDRDLVAGHMQRMRAEAELLRGAEVERGLCHGDLTPDNLFADTPRTGVLRLTAIDMQGSAVMALARDMARLLVWLESRREKPAARVRDGIALPDWLALTEVRGLMASDQAPILRFLIGEVMLAYYLDSARQPLRRRALVRAMRDWAAQEGTVRPVP